MTESITQFYNEAYEAEMTEYITKEQADALFSEVDRDISVKPWDVRLHRFANAAIAHHLEAKDVYPVAKRNAAVVAMYDRPAPDARIILSSQEIYDIAHRKATRYTCTAKSNGVMYGFSELHILDFVAAYKGETK